MAYTDLHVNGPARVNVALTGGAYSNFGFTEDGVEITPTIYHEDVPTDDYGPSMPGDVQFMGAEFKISLPMVRWDLSVMNSVLAFIRSSTVGAFSSAEIGSLMIAGGKYMGLRIVSSARSGGSTEPTHVFPYAWPVGDIPFKVGTRVTRHRITFRAIYNSGTLFQRS